MRCSDWVDELSPWVPPVGHRVDEERNEEELKADPNSFASSMEYPSTPQKRTAYPQAPTPDSSPSKRPRLGDEGPSSPSPSPSHQLLPFSTPTTSIITSGSQLPASSSPPTHDQMIEYHKLMKAEGEKKARLSIAALKKAEFTSSRLIKTLQEEIRYVLL